MSDPSNTPNRVDEVIARYLEAVESGSAPDRDAWLARYPELADELRAFFAAESQLGKLAAEFPADPSRDLTIDSPEKPRAGDVGALKSIRYFGDYELLGEIARGGMGVVYRARQVSVKRLVAVKMILAGHLATAADIQRFRSEAATAANLDHPNIVPIYEVGEHEGQHYFSMKLIEGPTIAECGLRIADWQERQRWVAQLIATVARAVHHAHQRGVLHRDLKPSNILLDASSESAIRNPQSAIPLVTDFGLAKHITGDGGVTQTGAIVGTPEYMAPEQAAGQKDLTTAADVYSLGAILYALLTGQPPFRGATILETLQLVAEKEPTSPQALNGKVDRDLATICLKSLEKNPSRRYPSGKDFADDLLRWRHGEPILARPAGRFERALKWARRKPGAAAALGTGVFATAWVLILLGVLWYQAADRLHTERTLNQQLAQRADTLDKQAATIRGQAETERALRRTIEGEHAKVREQLHISRNLTFNTQLLRVESLGRTDPAKVTELLNDTETCPPDLRDFSFGIYKHLAQPLRRTIKTPWSEGELSATQPPHSTTTSAQLLLSPNGQMVALWHPKLRERQPITTLPDLVLWNRDTGEERLRLPRAGSLSFSRDWQRMAWTESGGGASRQPATGKLILWNTLLGKEEPLPKDLPTAPSCVALSPDGNLLAVSGGQETNVVLLDLVKGAKQQTLSGTGEPVVWLRFSPDGSRLAALTSLARQTVKVWNVADGKEQYASKLLGTNVRFHFTHDGQSLVGSFHDRFGQKRQAWDLASGRERELTAQEEPPWLTEVDRTRETCLTRSENHHFLATAGRMLLDESQRSEKAASWEIRVWETTAGRLRTRLEETGWRGSYLLAISADGRTLASLTTDPGNQSHFAPGVLKLWDISERPQPAAVLRWQDSFPRNQEVMAAPDGKLLVALHEGRSVTVWDLVAGKPVTTIKEDSNVETARLSPDGKLLALHLGAKVNLRAFPSGMQMWTVDATVLGSRPARHPPLYFSHDGKEVGAGGGLSRLCWFDTVTGKQLPPFAENSGSKLYEPRPRGGHLVALAPNGKTTAVAGALHSANEVYLWDPTTGTKENEARGPLSHQRERILALAFSPDSRILASSSGRHWVSRHSQPTPSSGPGTTRPGELKFWDTSTGMELRSLRGFKGEITALAFSPDGKTLATGGHVCEPLKEWGTAEVQLWDPVTGQLRCTLQTPAAVVLSLAFTCDGKKLGAFACAAPTEEGVAPAIGMLWQADD